MLGLPRSAIDQRPFGTRRPRHGRARRIAGLGAAVAVGLLLAGPGPLQAAPTRTEDQRLVHPSVAPEGSHLGASVATSRPRDGAFTLAGAHEGFVIVFGYAAPDWGTNITIGMGAPAVQFFPMDLELGQGIVAVRHASGDTTIRALIASGFAGDLITGVEGTYVKAVARYGNALVLGQPDEDGGAGRILIYEWNAVFGWIPVATFEGAAGDRLGSALAINDGVIVAGAPGYGDNGAVQTYLRAGEEWIQWVRLDSPAESQIGAEFGAAVDISLDGEWVAVGSYAVDNLVVLPGQPPEVNIGAVYLYQSGLIGWDLDSLLRPLEASEFDNFGWSVALHEDALVAGSPGEDGGSVDEGAAYVYQLAGTQWQKRLRLVDSTPEADEQLGWSVALGDLGAVVGAPYFDGNGVLDQGAVLAYGNVVSLFADGFESGDFSAWSSVAP